MWAGYLGTAEREAEEEFLLPGALPRPDNENLPDLGRPGPGRRFRLRLPMVVERAAGRRQRSLSQALQEERSHGRLMLLSPVACGAGALSWFSAQGEPSAVYIGMLCLVFCFCFLILRYRHPVAAILAATLALAALGACLAAFETARKATVILDKPVTTTIAGTVLSREPSGEGRWRYEIALASTGNPSLRRMPAALAVFVRSNGQPAEIGDRIKGRARLSPPSGPALPGLTDFAFQSYFNGLGGTGFFYGEPTVSAASQDEGAGLKSWFYGWRAGIGDHIRSVIGGDEGAFAAALVTNEQRAISAPTMEALRLSGLAHIIAISGMNMALAAGLSFVGLRMLLALSVGFSHSLPIKKIAALGAILAVSAYYVISGFAVSAERAYIMMVIMLVAVLFDRPAISMRNIALSAWVILLTSPDALMGASFQMSYAGTLGLVAGYEFWARHRPVDRDAGLPFPRPVRAIAGFLSAAVISSAIGGTATALFSLVHFQRLATFGLVANVLVTPLLSFLVMPMLMLGMLLMPLHLDAWPLLVTGWGLKWVIATGTWVASWGGEWLPGPIPIWYFAVASLSLLLLALLRGSLRLIGIGLLAGASLVLALMPAPPRPDLLIAEDGLLAAFVGRHALSPNRAKPPDFIFGQWQRALRQDAFLKPVELQPEPVLRSDDRADRYRPLTDEEEIAERVFLDRATGTLAAGRFACKKASWCAARLPGGGLIAIVENSIYTGLACDMAAIVVANPSPRFTACRSGALLITRETLRRTGALTLRFTGNATRPVITPSFRSLDRPWQAFRAYDWRSGKDDPALPPAILSLAGDRPALEDPPAVPSGSGG